MDVFTSNCYGNKEFENARWYVASQICICWSNMLTTVLPNKKILCSKINTFLNTAWHLKDWVYQHKFACHILWFLLWVCFWLAVNLCVTFFFPMGIDTPGKNANFLLKWLFLAVQRAWGWDESKVSVVQGTGVGPEPWLISSSVSSLE